MIECISVSNDCGMAEMKSLYHRAFSSDYCARDEKGKHEEVRGKSKSSWCQRVVAEVGINGWFGTRFNQPD